MAIGLGIPVGTFRRSGADFTPYMQMKEMEMQAARDRQAEAEFRAGLNQSQQAMALDKAQFDESRRQFDAGLAESREARAAQERIAAQRQQGKSGTNDLTAREELLYDHLNEQLAMAKYLLSKAQTSEDRARYQAEIDRLQGEILRILKPGEQAAAPGILPGVARKEDAQQAPGSLPYMDSIGGGYAKPPSGPPAPVKDINKDRTPPKPIEPAAPEAKPKELLPSGRVKYKRGTPEPAKPAEPTKPLPPGTPSWDPAKQDKMRRDNPSSADFHKFGLSPVDARAVADSADVKIQSDPDWRPDFVTPATALDALLKWWHDTGRVGKPSDLLR